MKRLLLVLLIAAPVVAARPIVASAAEKYVLEEPNGDARVFRVEVRPEVKGQLDTATGDGKAVAHDLTVTATLKYLERRLSGTGRDAESLRSLRHYEEAGARIEVDQQLTSSRLREGRKLLVAQGRREGISVYSSSGRMSYEEIELLRVPGDSLAALALLPPKPVELGEKWTVPSWGAQMLAGAEAALKSDLVCTLERVDADVAHVKFAGHVEGASAGAAAAVDIEGHYQFDLRKKVLRRLEISQAEKRTVGPVTPGMRVTARVVTERTPSSSNGPLTDAAVAAVPLVPDASAVMLEFRSPWNVQFEFDRNWHVFHQSEKVSVLRLLDKGSLIAQCNLSLVPAAAAGQHTSEAQFEKDIRAALGDRVRTVEKGEVLAGSDGCYRYRVAVIGEANKIPMQWIYYLCADASGKQVAFVFAVESKLAEQLAGRDLAIVQSLRFLTAAGEPAKAAAR
jgi:hypothetical protein